MGDEIGATWVRIAATALAVMAVACRDETAAGARLAPPAVSAVLGTSNPASPVRVRLQTSSGAVHCTLDPTRAPRGVASFVGLATGRTAFRDVKSGAIVKRPFYDGLTFFRAVPGALVQTGCPRGDGTGHPGYRFPVEPSPDDRARLAVPGALVLARYTPPPGRQDPDPPDPLDVHGSQFAITMTDMSHLTGTVTVLGACGDLDVVRAIADGKLRGGAPVLEHVVLEP